MDGTMRIPFSVLFLLLILGEIAVFIQVGEAIGVLSTLGLTLFGMVAGALLLRFHGMATLVKVQAEIEAGRTPGRPLADGAMSAVAALLIMIPGFLTDAMGILLFLPPVREAIWRGISRRIKVVRPSAPRQERQGPIVDLDPSQYGTHPRPDSPWRPDRPDASLRGPEA
jgi:UPF0716 protein FxsA